MRSAKNVGKVWISRKTLLILVHAISDNCFHGPKKNNSLFFCAYVLLFIRFGSLAAIHPWWGNRYSLTKATCDTQQRLIRIMVKKTYYQGH